MWTVKFIPRKKLFNKAKVNELHAKGMFRFIDQNSPVDITLFKDHNASNHGRNKYGSKKVDTFDFSINYSNTMDKVNRFVRNRLSVASGSISLIGFVPIDVDFQPLQLAYDNTFHGLNFLLTHRAYLVHSDRLATKCLKSASKHQTIQIG